MSDLYVANFYAVPGSPVGGPGYISGEPPDGLVTNAGTPVCRKLLVLHAGIGRVVAQTYSDSVDGTYRIDNLNPAEEFFVIMVETARVEQDQIKGRVHPLSY